MKDLITCRKEIDIIDEKLIYLLAQRLSVVDEVAKFKASHKLNALDESRWEQVIKSREDLARRYNLNPEFVIDIYNLIHKYALKQEEHLLKK